MGIINLAVQILMMDDRSNKQFWIPNDTDSTEGKSRFRLV